MLKRMEIIDNVDISPTAFSNQNMRELTMYGMELIKDIFHIDGTQKLTSLNFNKAHWK